MIFWGKIPFQGRRPKYATRKCFIGPIHSNFFRLGAAGNNTASKKKAADETRCQYRQPQKRREGGGRG